MGKRYYSKLLIKQNKKIFFLEVDLIDWLESAGNRTNLHVGDREFSILEPLGSLENKLDPLQFMRIHESYIVNVDRIKYIEQWFKGDYEVILKDETRLTMNNSFKQSLELFR